MVRIGRLDNGNVRVHVDCRLRTGSVRQYFSMPKEDGPRDEEATLFAEILARSFRRKDMLLTGTCGGKTARAMASGPCRSQKERFVMHIKIELAKSYLEAGLSVLPAKRREKRPAVGARLAA